METNDKISDLESHVGYWLRFVSNHVSYAFKLKVELEGVTVAEWVVLRGLYDVAEIHPSQVAEQLGLTRGAVSKLIERLVIKKLVKVRPEKKDRRFQSVGLTDTGRKLVPKLAGQADQNDGEFFGCLSKQERAQLRSLLIKIVQKRELKGVPVD